MRSYLLFALVLCKAILLTTVSSYAGIIRGRVTDEQGAALAFANVAVRTTATSTATNEQGNYQLKLPPGRYELVFQYVGYKPRTEAVQVAGGDTLTVLNVSLQTETYNVGEVLVRSTDRDPAYALVQHAIQWRRYHRAEIAAFSARTYIKAIIRLTDVPGKILGIIKTDPSLKPGVVYLSESVSELSFRQPNQIRERMISSRVSGSSKGFSFNRASGRSFNFYDNLIQSGFSERGFVSPVAQNAMLFYRYELMGTSTQDGRQIHKIRVTPRRRNDPAFTGFIYLVDGTWRLHSLELSLNQNSGIEYVESIRIAQQFAPAPGPSDVWVMQSQKVSLVGEGFGFKGNGSFNAILSDYRVTPTYPNRPDEKVVAAAPVAATATPAPVGRETVTDVKKQRPELGGISRQLRQQTKLADKQLEQQARAAGIEPLAKGEVMRVEEGANERDSAYWAQIRPIPLTDEESRDYQVKDSTEVIKKSKPYQDSLDRKRNQVEPIEVLLTGYEYSNSFRRRTVRLEPIFNTLQYSTVEGVIVNAQATYTQRFEDRRNYSFTPTLRYGFAARLFSPSLAGGYTYKPLSFTRIGFVVGRTIENFDPASQLTPFINTQYTLLRNTNYAKYYQRDGGEINFRTELVNGLTLRTALGYADRQELQNATIKTIVDVPGRAFTPNDPINEELPGGTSFGRSQSLTAFAELLWQSGQQYIIRPTGKFNLGSKYPTFRLGLRQSFGGVLGSDVRYSRLEGGLRKTLELGLFGESNFDVTVGGFLGQPQLSFMDYRHFAGNQTIFAADFNQFQLLDYYTFSTRRSYIEGHYNHHFNGFFLNKIPLLRRLKWQEVASLNYLRTPTVGHYVELGAGVEHIFKLFRVDVYTALRSGQKLDTGIRIGAGF
ncbi:hypothetical protein SAMN00120144_3519 [Hymenobacter roseosalivarius DSM 11622]|uniref:Carboxypeptidase-like regulatory domain-containing protein n=1 Tax=Hymenobacter roseosalivarius DSM 11622 TaxID=645990 RepID=A0A1W1VXG4_9BACT|nr:DUF5686 and carboxypeptidase regulatory-like domain-containing protein [Hymenobacter roseosalivarius]SMB98026.1 hypothetical protein SAMN00120144_3519 [Hymenobacter roseosalivarius DSM 11622]